MPETLPELVVVEDSPEDFEATRRALARGGLANPIVHFATGDAALDYLLGGTAEQRQRRPALILLDLNLPGTDGRQVLARLKADSALRPVPIVVMTTSRDARDVAACYDAGANSYVQKPVDLAGFQRALQLLREYWFDVVVLPHHV